MVWDWQVSRVGSMLFYSFPFLIFFSIGWHYGDVVFRLIRCKSLFPSLTLPISFNNNNNNNFKNRSVRAVAVTYSFKFEMIRCRTFQFARRLLPAHLWVWNGDIFSVFESGTLNGSKGTVNCLLLPFLFCFCSAAACWVVIYTHWL